MKIGTTSRLLAALLILSATAAAGAAAFFRTDPPAFGANQILARLPRGSSVHSLLRADLDGRPPEEVAAVARIPAYPGAGAIVHTALIFRYDRVRRTYVESYRAPTPARVPFSVDAVRLATGRDVILFSGLQDDGTRAFEVVGLTRGRGTPQSGDAAREALARLAVPLPGVTWRYVVRSGAVVARTSTVRLHVRQTLRVQASGGGPASVVLPDPRLDVVESGFRARTPGNYRIRVVTGFLPIEEAFTLAVIVEP